MPSHLTTPRLRLSNGRYARIDIAQRFWAKVNKNGPVPEYAPHLGPCWLWGGSQNGDGYGQWWDGTRLVSVHRWAYEQEHGPIPPHLQSDHLCRVRNCVRPSHIEPVTQTENILRGESFSAYNVTKTHCPQGHAYSARNTYLNAKERRFCRICARERGRAFRQRRKATAPRP